LNNCQEEEVEEMLFWGKINGLNRDYYIAMGICYSGLWEFPDKTFYWASSTDFKFTAFPKLNDQHKDQVDTITDLFTGMPEKVLIKIEEPAVVEGEQQEAINRPQSKQSNASRGSKKV